MFNGKFCPECGAEYKDKNQCPKCGAQCEAEAKFCTVCGYSFSGKTAAGSTEAKPAAPKPAEHKNTNQNSAARLHTALSVLPAALLGLFTVLSLIFFALPTGVAVSFLGSESCGSVYQIFGGYATILDIRGCTIAAIIFGVCGVPVTLFAALFTFSRLHAGERMRCSAYVRNFKSIALGLGYGIYIAFIVISSVIIGTVSKSSNLLMQVDMGACPILLLVFSITFAVLSAACSIADYILKKNHTELVKEYESRSYTEPSPVRPDPVDVPKAAMAKGDALYNHKKAMRFADGLSVIGLIVGIPMIIASYFPIPINQSDVYGSLQILVICETIISSSFGFWCYAIIIALIVSATTLSKKKLYYNFNKAQKRQRRLVAYTIISAILLILGIVRLVVAIVAPEAINGIAIPASAFLSSGAGIRHDNDTFYLIFNLFPALVNLIAAIIALYMAGQANVALVGQKKLKGGELTEAGKLLVETDEAYLSQFEEQYAAYNAYLKATDEYNAECKNQEFEREMCQNGLDYKNEKMRKAYKIERNGGKHMAITVIFIIAAIIAVVIPAAVIAPETIEELTQSLNVFGGLF